MGYSIKVYNESVHKNYPFVKSKNDYAGAGPRSHRALDYRPGSVAASRQAKVFYGWTKRLGLPPTDVSGEVQRSVGKPAARAPRSTLARSTHQYFRADP